MSLSAKRAIISILSLSLLANLFLCIYLVQVKNNVDTYQEKIIELEEDNEYFKKQYKKYFELSEELENQMGVYYE